jgi:hypothetical protein
MQPNGRPARLNGHRGQTSAGGWAAYTGGMPPTESRSRALAPCGKMEP